MHRTWKFFDMLIVAAAIALGFAIWFIPNFANSPEMKKLVAIADHRFEVKKHNKEEAERRAKEKAEAAAALAKEREEQGLIFIAPPPPKGE
jgi:sugar phosphate permease